MGHSFLFLFLAGLLLSRLVFRRLSWLRARRAYAFGYAHRCGATSHHHAFRRYNFPPDAWGARRRRGSGDAAPSPNAPVVTGSLTERANAAFAALDLNKRQREEADQIVDEIRTALGAGANGWTGFEAALSAAGDDHFDRSRVDETLAIVPDSAGKTEIADALEHLHNILTDEQRAALRARR